MLKLLADENFDNTVEIGKADVVKTGDKCTLVSFSYMMKFVNEAAQKLSLDGIEVEVIDLRTIQPLDIETILNSVKKTNRLVVVEEGWGFAGIASEVCSQVVENAFDYLDHEPLRVSAEFVPLPYAENLEKQCLPTVEKIVTAVKKTLQKAN